jgi:hypothetical protein
VTSQNYDALMAGLGSPTTHVDAGNPLWRASWDTAYWLARRHGPMVRLLVRMRVPSIGSRIAELQLTGRRTGRARHVFVSPIAIDERMYVGHANGETSWIANLVACESIQLTRPGGQTMQVRPIPLEVGSERTHVIEVAARQHLPYVRPLYWASRGHILRAGVYVRLDPITSPLDQSPAGAPPSSASRRSRRSIQRP